MREFRVRQKNTELLENFLDEKFLTNDNKITSFYFDNSDDKIIKKYNADVIKLDGTEGKINIFEIFRICENAEKNFEKHIKKLEIIYKLMVKNVRQNELDMFIILMRRIYQKKGILDVNGKLIISEKNPKIYPTITEVIDYITSLIDIRNKYVMAFSNKNIKFDLVGFLQENNIDKEDYIFVEQEIKKITYAKRLEKIKYTLNHIRREYGYAIDGETTIKISDNKCVYYDLESINNIQKNIFYVITYNLVYYEISQCVTDESNRYIVFTELREVIYLNNKGILEQLIKVEKELKKCEKTDLVFLIDDIRTYLPNHAFNDIVKELKKFFVTTSYKIITRQKENTQQVLMKILGEYYDINEINDIFIKNSKKTIYIAGNMTIVSSIAEIETYNRNNIFYE